MSGQHPTLIVGYGVYGRSLLLRLLVEAAERGVLLWEDPPGAADPGARRLGGVALLWVENPADHVTSGIGSDLERDLWAQVVEVRPIPASGPPETKAAFRAAVVAAKDRLLDARRGASPQRLHVGLDVFVVAQPTGPEVLGSLEDLLLSALDALAADPGLRRPAQGSDLLNVIQVLDFDRYWESTPAAKELRREVRAWVERWQNRARSGEPSPGRIYLLDGLTSDGRRDADLRLEQAALFLEFSLFEGQRDQESLRSLYQRERDDIPPAAAFGIRLLERSRGLLSRLAAARFAHGWLAYLAGSEPIDAATTRKHIDEALAPFQPAALDLGSARAEFRKVLDDGMEGIVRQLGDLPAEDERWPALVREAAETAILRLKAELANWAGDKAAVIANQHLKGLAGRLQGAFGEALHHADHPAPLGFLIDRIEDLRASLRAPSPTAHGESDLAGGFEDLEAAHNDFLRARSACVKPDKLAEWWPLLAVVVAAAWTPVAIEAFDEITPPDVSSPAVWTQVYAALAAVAKPFVLAPGFLLAAWAVGRFGVHPQLKARLDQLWSEFTHPARGRLVGAIRKVFSQGPMHQHLEHYGESLLRNMEVRLHGEIDRELVRALERLRARQNEAQWLQLQVRDFLRTHGIDPSSSSDVDSPFGGNYHYRVSLERGRDLERILQCNPATPERFRSAQSSRRPFEGWAEVYSRLFLYPLVFLDDLSRDYEEDPAEQLARSDDERRELADEILRFLKQRNFSAGIDWTTTGGPAGDATDAFCVLPAVWRDLPGIALALHEQAYTDQRILTGADPDRAYLLRLQTGIASSYLAGEEE